jgi:small subunit ribosomal protein S3e
MIGECMSTALFVLIQVIVSGKLRAQRAKSMKFKDGYMISSGQPVNEYIDSAVRHVLLRQVCFATIARCNVCLSLGKHFIFDVPNVISQQTSFSVVQGVLGIKVKIMLDWDPKGKVGPITPLPDLVTIHTPKEEDELRPPVLAAEV